MRILVLDDDASKLAKLLPLLESCGVVRDSIAVARSADSARALLRETRFDIAFLDLLIPLRDESEAKLETSLQLLRDLHDRDEYFKPHRIVGLTAYEAAAMDAAPDFEELTWRIIVFDPTSDEWEEQARRMIKYIAAASAKRVRIKYEVDLCVITALPSPELEAVLAIPWSWEAAQPLDDLTFARFGSFASGANKYRAVAATAPRMGSVACALLASRMIEHVRPRFLVMAGICAGVKQKANYGDAVLFSPSWEWASGKVVAEGTSSYLEPAPHQIAVPEFVLARAEELRKLDQFWLSSKAYSPVATDILPKLVIAPGASGSSVIAHEPTSDAIKAQHRKLAAIDMEVYGMMAAAAQATSPRPTSFAIKGVADFADEEKEDTYQKYAATVSANAIRTFFEVNMATIWELAGT
jgi:nucleoside phosphorylase/CheY-like chemotaxis protein